MDDVTADPTILTGLSNGSANDTFEEETNVLLATDHGSSFLNINAKIVVGSSGLDLTAGTIYQISVAMRGGIDNSSGANIVCSMAGVVVTAIGA